jgi:hypothetical protein
MMRSVTEAEAVRFIEHALQFLVSLAANETELELVDTSAITPELLKQSVTGACRYLYLMIIRQWLRFCFNLPTSIQDSTGRFSA